MEEFGDEHFGRKKMGFSHVPHFLPTQSFPQSTEPPTSVQVIPPPMQAPPLVLVSDCDKSRRFAFPLQSSPISTTSCHKRQGKSGQ